MSFFSKGSQHSAPPNRHFTHSSDDEGDFGHHPPNINRFRHFSPSARKSGEEILRDLKQQLRREGDMFFNNSPPDWGFGPNSSMFSKADEGEEGRRGMFRMPGWGGDDAVSQLAARMSQTPPMSSTGRRGGAGPWRERRGSGGSAMSATSEDSSEAPDRGSQGSTGSGPDAVGHEIPIRFEAPAPPHPQTQAPQELENDAVGPLVGPGRCPQRTTSAVDATEQGIDTTRNSRCASAPPDVTQAPGAPGTPGRFVSKLSITPQPAGQGPQGSNTLDTGSIPMGPGSPHDLQGPPQDRGPSPLPAKFNTVPRPFVPAGKAQPDPQPQQYMPEHPQQQPQPQQQWQQQPYQQQPMQDPQWQYQQYPQQQYPPQQQQYPQPQQQYQQEPPQPPQRSQRPSVVRNIPIFVEGRDDPSNDPRGSSQWQATKQPQQNQHQQPQNQYQPQPNQYQPQQNQFQPQPTQYQQPPHFQTSSQQYPPQPQQFEQPQFPPQQFQQPQPPQQPKQQFRPPKPVSPPAQPIPQPVPMPMPDPHPQEAPKPQETPAAEQPQEPKPNDQDPRLTQIAAVGGLVADYAGRVGAFSGGRKSREFMYLDEMLTRLLLQLDNVDPEGRQDVRQARRTVIKEINGAISFLESKAVEWEKANPPTEQKTEVMETEGQSGEQKAAEAPKAAETSESQGSAEGSKSAEAPKENEKDSQPAEQKAESAATPAAEPTSETKS